jgi:hypothetical protein
MVRTTARRSSQHTIRRKGKKHGRRTHRKHRQRGGVEPDIETQWVQAVLALPSFQKNQELYLFQNLVVPFPYLNKNTSIPPTDIRNAGASLRAAFRFNENDRIKNSTGFREQIEMQLRDPTSAFTEETIPYAIAVENHLRELSNTEPVIARLEDTSLYPLFIWALMASVESREPYAPVLDNSPLPTNEVSSLLPS